MYVYIYIYTHIYIYIYIRGRALARGGDASPADREAEGLRTVRKNPLVEIIPTVPCLAIRGKASDSRQRHLSQQYPPL